MAFLGIKGKDKQLAALEKKVDKLSSANKKLWEAIEEIIKSGRIQSDINIEVKKKFNELRDYTDNIVALIDSIDGALVAVKSYLQEDGTIPSQEDFMQRLRSANQAIANWKAIVMDLEDLWYRPEVDFGATMTKNKPNKGD